MKDKQKYKDLQAKLNNHISEFAGTLTKMDSKRLKKSIKKASKMIAKSILKNADESEVKISLTEKPAGKSVPSKKTISRKNTTNRKRRRTLSRKPVTKSTAPEKTIVKENGYSDGQAQPAVVGEKQAGI